MNLAQRDISSCEYQIPSLSELWLPLMKTYSHTNAETPCITNSDDGQPEDQGKHSHGFPKDDSNHPPKYSPLDDDFNSGNYHSPLGPPSQGLSQPKESSEDVQERNWDNTHVLDVLRDHSSSDSNEEHLPGSHTQPNKPLPKHQKPESRPPKSAVSKDLAEWKELPRRSG